ncbi:MAG: DUF2062 domain-containing protein [Elusimicrobia bacterium]|nr:DUF2062 domain-containing protein [Elusimicrobiota bacterium]
MKLPSLDKKSTLRLIKESLDSPLKIAEAVALGVFFGIAPVWGFQLILALLFASILKVNRLIAAAASNISIPPMIPVIVFASLKTGGFVMRKPWTAVPFPGPGGLLAVKGYLLQYLVGSVLLASLCAMAAGAIVYAFALAGGRSGFLKTTAQRDADFHGQKQNMP